MLSRQLGGFAALLSALLGENPGGRLSSMWLESEDFPNHKYTSSLAWTDKSAPRFPGGCAQKNKQTNKQILFFLNVLYQPFQLVKVVKFTLRKRDITLPQWIPLASWVPEYSRSLAWIRAYATRLLLLSNHTKTSGVVCCGCV